MASTTADVLIRVCSTPWAYAPRRTEVREWSLLENAVHINALVPQR